MNRFSTILLISSIVALMIVNFAGALSSPGKAKFYTVTASERTISNGDIFTRGQRVSTLEGKIIGNAFLSCTRIARNENFGYTVEQCTGTYNLPLGKMTVAGSRSSRSRYTLVVTGGTGFYNNVGGKLNVYKIGVSPTTERVIFSLVP